MDAKTMIVAILGIVVGGAVLLSPAACTMRRHQVVADAIKNGADPISAKCAIESDNSMSPVCIVRAQEPSNR